jgi:hypothetical protein
MHHCLHHALTAATPRWVRGRAQYATESWITRSICFVSLRRKRVFLGRCSVARGACRCAAGHDGPAHAFVWSRVAKALSGERLAAGLAATTALRSLALDLVNGWERAACAVLPCLCTLDLSRV